jgi:hypothetical protein
MTTTISNTQSPSKVINANYLADISSARTWTSQYEGAFNEIREAMLLAKVADVGVILWGEPGVGKTYFAETLQRHPTFAPIERKEYTTLPVLYVRSPNKADTKELLTSMLRELGPGEDLGKPAERKARLLYLLAAREVQVIIIDEAHDYLPQGNPKGGDIPKSMNFIRWFIDEIEIPLVLMGTKRLLNLREYGKSNGKDTELAQRFSVEYHFSILPYGLNKEAKGEFAGIVENYADKLPIKTELFSFLENGTAVKTAFLDQIYLATNGDFRHLRDLFLRIGLFMEKHNKFDKSDCVVIRERLFPSNPINYDAFSISDNVVKSRLKLLFKSAAKEM